MLEEETTTCSDAMRLASIDLTDGRNPSLITLSIPVSSVPNGLLFFWTVSLYKNKHEYTTRNCKESGQKWQDHWLQAFYALDVPENASKSIELVAFRTDTNWRFDCCVSKKEVSSIKESIQKPLRCTCGYHALLNTQLIAMYNDATRQSKLTNLLNRILLNSQKSPIRRKSMHGIIIRSSSGYRRRQSPLHLSFPQIATAPQTDPFPSRLARRENRLSSTVATCHFRQHGKHHFDSIHFIHGRKRDRVGRSPVPDGGPLCDGGHQLLVSREPSKR